MNKVAEKVLDALDKALAEPKPTPPPQPPTFETLAKRIAGMAEKPLATKSELAELARLQKEHETASAAMLKYTVFAAKDAWLQHEKQLIASIRTGGTDSFDGWTRSDWESDFGRKQEASKVARAEISTEAAPIARAIAARFSTLTGNLADAIESREKADAEKFGLIYSPSPTVCTLRTCAATALRHCGGMNSPRQMLPFINL